MSDQISLAFDLIRQFAEREGWVPIGWRDWTVGLWRIRVNGTSEKREGIPPYHALVEHSAYVALLLIHPMGGIIGGWQQAEDEFIQAMQDALATEPA